MYEVASAELLELRLEHEDKHNLQDMQHTTNLHVI